MTAWERYTRARKESDKMRRAADRLDRRAIKYLLRAQQECQHAADVPAVQLALYGSCPRCGKKL